jgi:hypothetical protein
MIGIGVLRKPLRQFFNMGHGIRAWQTKSAVTSIGPYNNLFPQHTKPNIT